MKLFWLGFVSILEVEGKVIIVIEGKIVFNLILVEDKGSWREICIFCI